MPELRQNILARQARDSFAHLQTKGSSSTEGNIPNTEAICNPTTSDL